MTFLSNCQRKQYDEEKCDSAENIVYSEVVKVNSLLVFHKMPVEVA